MALIPYPDLENLEPQAQRIIDAFVKEHGRPTPLYAMMAHFAPAIRSTGSMYNSIMNTGKFDRRFKELLFVAASHVRNCFYWVGGHSRFLVKEYNMDPETVKTLRAGKEVSGTDPKELALIRFGRKVAKDATQISDADIEALRDKGLENDEIAEALSVVMLSALTNTFASALKIEEDVEPAVLKEYF